MASGIHMCDPKDPRQPVIRGRASIAHCEIKVTVLWRSQLDGLIRYLTDQGFPFEWDVRHGDSMRPDEFTLKISSICWAYNATAICQELEKCDYQDDIPEPDDSNARLKSRSNAKAMSGQLSNETGA